MITTEQLYQTFSRKKILVIGDVMIDAYLRGTVSRISPEAPVPIVDIQERFYRLGGAANVALNLHALGATPILCSVIGADEKGALFLQLMNDKGLDNQFLNQSNQRKTTIKYRVVGNKSQMLRIDEEDRHPLTQTEETKLLQHIRQIIENQKIDAIIFEDYDKGTLTPTLIRTLVSLAKTKGIITTVDPKKLNFNYFQEVTLFKPNLKELQEGLNHSHSEFSLPETQALMAAFATQNNIDFLFTTLSERGVLLYDRHLNSFFHEPAYLRKISDVSGAGDTVISVVTLCLTAGLSPVCAARIANLSGGIVCEHSGVVPIPWQQLQTDINTYKILDTSK